MVKPLLKVEGRMARTVAIKVERTAVNEKAVLATVKRAAVRVGTIVVGMTVLLRVGVITVAAAAGTVTGITGVVVVTIGVVPV